MDALKLNACTAICEVCGVELAPGEGHRRWVPDAHDNDDFDRVGGPNESAHWAVHCLDSAACEARVAELRAAEAARQAEKQRIRRETAAEAAAIAAVKKAAWEAEVAGLVRLDYRPNGSTLTGETFDNGTDCRCEKESLASGAIGWRVSWIGDLDGCYWLVPAADAEIAATAKAAEFRVYGEYWKPGKYAADCYPGPGVPEAELTEAEQAEVARCRAAKLAAIAADWNRQIPAAIVPGDWKGAKGCQGWEALKGLGLEPEIIVDPADFDTLVTASAAGQKTTITVTLRAVLPEKAKNKNGSVKAAFAKKLPSVEGTMSNRVKVRYEYL